MLSGIRQDRALAPLVTYNTWFAYGTNVDEASMRVEIGQAAALGAELFVVDAGWYASQLVGGLEKPNLWAPWMELWKLGCWPAGEAREKSLVLRLARSN